MITLTLDQIITTLLFILVYLIYLALKALLHDTWLIHWWEEGPETI